MIESPTRGFGEHPAIAVDQDEAGFGPTTIHPEKARGGHQCPNWYRRTPVSYTHLDVYKRQVSRTVMADMMGT